MRIFLDNKGVGFKTVQVHTTDNMYELCATMEKKIQLVDLTGFGIYEVRDQRGNFLFHHSFFTLNIIHISSIIMTPMLIHYKY